MRRAAVLCVLLTGIVTGQVNSPGRILGRELAKEYKPEELVTISGTVVNSITGDPVPRARVSATSVNIPIGPLSSVTADESGAFTLTGLPPGSYTLFADRAGFVQNRAMGLNARASNRNRAQASAGEKLTGVRVLIVPQALVTGRILDANGDPVSGAIVSAQPVRRTNRPFQQNVQSNDLGEYRLFGLEPGRYIVAADVRPEAGGPRALLPNLPPPPDDLEQAVRTYYPRALEESEASTILLKPGDARQGIDIQLQSARLARISGRVVLPPNWQNPMAENTPPGFTAEVAGNLPLGQVSVVPLRSAAAFSNRSSGGPIKANGEFLISGVVPGTYRLSAHLPSGKSSATNVNRIASAVVEVRGRNVENVVLTFREMVAATAVLKFENPGSTPPRVTLNLIPLNGIGGAYAHFDSQKGGELRFTPVEPGSYRLMVTGVTCDCYVKSLEVNGRDAENGIVEIGDSAETAIQLKFAEPAARIDGRVAGDDGKALSGYSVVLWPESNKRPDRYKFARTDAEGKFSLDGVAPGSYLLTSVSSTMWMGAWSLELDAILDELADKAEKVTVNEPSRMQKDLRASEIDY